MNTNHRQAALGIITTLLAASLTLVVLGVLVPRTWGPPPTGTWDSAYWLQWAKCSLVFTLLPCLAGIYTLARTGLASRRSTRISSAVALAAFFPVLALVASAPSRYVLMHIVFASIYVGLAILVMSRLMRFHERTA